MMQHIRDHDWSATEQEIPSPYFIDPADLENSVTMRIIRNRFFDPMLAYDEQREVRNTEPIDWDEVFNPTQAKTLKKYVPGLRAIPKYPKRSALSANIQARCLRVLCAKNPHVLPLYDIRRPTLIDERIYDKAKRIYEAEQAEYIEWARSVWRNGGCLKTIRTKQPVEKTYEAEFQMRSHAVESMPKEYTMFATVPLRRGGRFEFTHVKDFINVNTSNLPKIIYPQVLTSKFTVVQSCPTPTPCRKHPCRIVLPTEKSMSILPLDDVHHELATFALKEGADAIASEGALKCMLETDRSWTLPLTVWQGTKTGGDKVNITVIGSEFMLQKETAQRRNYRALKHMLHSIFTPIKLETEESDCTTESIDSLESVVIEQVATVESERSQSRTISPFSDDDDKEVVVEPATSVYDSDDNAVEAVIKPTTSKNDSDDDSDSDRLVMDLPDEEEKKDIAGNRSAGNSESEEIFTSKRSRAQEATSRVSKAGCSCKDTPPPRSFKMWELIDENSKCIIDPIKVIVHCAHKARKDSSEVIIEPIPEYLLELSGTEHTKEQQMSLALSLMLRKDAVLLDTRVDALKGELVSIEEKRLEEITSDEIKQTISSSLYSFFDDLTSVQPGTYILNHEKNDENNAVLYCSEDLDNREKLSLTSPVLRDEADEIVVPPNFGPVLLPYHKYRNILPCAFTPHHRHVAGTRKPIKRRLMRRIPIKKPHPAPAADTVKQTDNLATVANEQLCVITTYIPIRRMLHGEVGIMWRLQNQQVRQQAEIASTDSDDLTSQDDLQDADTDSHLATRRYSSSESQAFSHLTKLFSQLTFNEQLSVDSALSEENKVSPKKVQAQSIVLLEPVNEEVKENFQITERLVAACERYRMLYRPTGTVKDIPRGTPAIASGTPIDDPRGAADDVAPVPAKDDPLRAADDVARVLAINDPRGATDDVARVPAKNYPHGATGDVARVPAKDDPHGTGKGNPHGAIKKQFRPKATAVEIKPCNASQSLGSANDNKNAMQLKRAEDDPRGATGDVARVPAKDDPHGTGKGNPHGAIKKQFRPKATAVESKPRNASQSLGSANDNKNAKIKKRDPRGATGDVARVPAKDDPHGTGKGNPHGAIKKQFRPKATAVEIKPRNASQSLGSANDNKNAKIKKRDARGATGDVARVPAKDDPHGTGKGNPHGAIKKQFRPKATAVEIKPRNASQSLGSANDNKNAMELGLPPPPGCVVHHELQTVNVVFTIIHCIKLLYNFQFYDTEGTIRILKLTEEALQMLTVCVPTFYSEENQTDSKENQTDSEENQTDSEENQTDSKENQTDSKENQTDSKENQTDSKENQTDSKENQTDSKENQTDSEENQTDSEENQTDSKENQTDSKENQTDSKENQTDSKENQTDSKENQTDSKENQTDSKENQTDSVKQDSTVVNLPGRQMEHFHWTSRFRTFDLHSGMLFFAHSMENPTHFVSMFMRDKRIHFRFSVGDNINYTEFVSDMNYDAEGNLLLPVEPPCDPTLLASLQNRVDTDGVESNSQAVLTPPDFFGGLKELTEHFGENNAYIQLFRTCVYIFLSKAGTVKHAEIHPDTDRLFNIETGGVCFRASNNTRCNYLWLLEHFKNFNTTPSSEPQTSTAEASHE